MRNQRGSALAIVLILLAAGGLLGAGLMLQSQLDSKVSTAKASHVRSINLADGAARLALKSLKLETTELQESQLYAQPTVLFSSDPEDLGAWVARKTLLGLAGGGATPPGDEEGTEAHTASMNYLAEGVGDKGRGWVVNTYYEQFARVTHRGSAFRCKEGKAHTSSLSNEPGNEDATGWQDYWEPVAPGQTVVQIAVGLRVTD